MQLRIKKEKDYCSVSCLQPGENAARYDLIVAGLGTAGVFAALTAARKGLRVLGLENGTCCGGTGTAGGVHGYYFGTSGGAYEELDENIREMEKNGYMPAVGLNPDLKRYACEQELVRSGVDIHYESMVTGVLMEGKRILGVQWVENGRERIALAPVTVDCTGEAQLCEIAGCPANMGRALDGQVQPYSAVQPEIHDESVVFWHYMDCGYIDALDNSQYSRACIDSACLKHYNLDDYSERRVLGICSLLGLREGRRIEGEETVTLKDYLEDRFTDHPAFYAYSNLDNHGRDLAFESETLQDWMIVAGLWGINISVPVPVEACIPKGYDGLMTAGRSLSVEHDIASCIRQRRDMQKCGEAAGCAAALSIQKGINVREVPYEELKESLLQTGCLKPEDDTDIWDLEGENWTKTCWLDSAEKIYNALGTDKPGIAIWSSRRMGDAIKGSLEKWLEDSNEQISRNSALALGLLGDRKALPLLRRMAEERDPYIPSTSRKYNPPRGLSAAYLLGRMRDKESVEILADMLTEQAAARADGYPYDVFIRSREEYYMQFFTTAAFALMRIREQYPSEGEKIRKLLQDGISNPYYISILENTSEHAMYISRVAHKMRAIILGLDEG